MQPADLLCEPPISWSEAVDAPLYLQAKEVQVQVNQIRAGQDPEAEWIAEFWSDDFGGVTFTPPGRWIAIANQVVAAESPDLAKAVELYAKMGMALTDAAIAVWHSKYTYNYEHPIHYIRRNFDPSWETIMNHPYTGVSSITPEFPG